MALVRGAVWLIDVLIPIEKAYSRLVDVLFVYSPLSLLLSSFSEVPQKAVAARSNLQATVRRITNQKGKNVQTGLHYLRCR